MEAEPTVQQPTGQASVEEEDSDDYTIPENFQEIYDMIRFPLNWKENGRGKEFRQNMRYHIETKQLTPEQMKKLFDKNASGDKPRTPPRPRPCLMSEIRGLKAILPDGKLERDDCETCKKIAWQFCGHLQYAEGVEDPAEPRNERGRCKNMRGIPEEQLGETRKVAHDEKRWILGIRK